MHAKIGKEKEDEEVCIIKKEDKDNNISLYKALLIWHLWKHQTNTIINVCITDTVAKFYISKPLQSVLAVQEKGKNGKRHDWPQGFNGVEATVKKTCHEVRMPTFKNGKLHQDNNDHLSCESNSLLPLQVMCAFFIDEHMPIAMQEWGRHQLRHSDSRPGSFSPQINCVGLAHTQANNNTIN
eukprot:15351824-Ditylum_brightwellii.AAC.1